MIVGSFLYWYWPLSGCPVLAICVTFLGVLADCLERRAWLSRCCRPASFMASRSTSNSSSNLLQLATRGRPDYKRVFGGGGGGWCQPHAKKTTKKTSTLTARARHTVKQLSFRYTRASHQNHGAKITITIMTSLHRPCTIYNRHHL